MAITTYAELVTAIANWLNRSDLTDRIPEFIALAEPQILRGPDGKGLRVTRMIQRATATISTDNQFSSVPSNFLEAITYTLSDGANVYKLEPAPLDSLADYRAISDVAATPRFYAMSGTAAGREFQHYPTPERSYTGTLVYYAKPSALGSGSGSTLVTTNWILDEAPDAYLYGALLQAGPYLRDPDMAAIWSDGFRAALEGLKTSEHVKGGKLRVDPALMARPRIFDITRG